MTTTALAPETLEGWYTLHQTFSLDRASLRELLPEAYDDPVGEFASTMAELLAGDGSEGWSVLVPLVGSPADVMVMHVRPTLDAIGEAQRTLARARLSDVMHPVEYFLSVTEAGLYHLTAQLAKAAVERGGRVGDDQYQAEMRQRMDDDLATEHVRRRLYPSAPDDTMPWVCVYPMNKKRETGQNWYTLPVGERSNMMRDHGITGRRYAGKVVQIIGGAIGLDAWEWAITLFAADPLQFKKIVSEMRFDEASAKFGEFGNFYVGRVTSARDWLRSLRLDS